MAWGLDSACTLREAGVWGSVRQETHILGDGVVLGSPASGVGSRCDEGLRAGTFLLLLRLKG